MLPQPAACSSRSCRASPCSRANTRPYPKLAISLFSSESDFRINKASENSGQENYSQLVSFESSQQLFAERQDGAGPGPTPGGLPSSEFSSCTPPADRGGNPRRAGRGPRLV